MSRSAYKVWIDRRASLVRQDMRRNCPRDIADGTLRLALHLSDVEHAYLVAHNPELGHEDTRLQDAAWARFIAHPCSAPFRVNKV